MDKQHIIVWGTAISICAAVLLASCGQSSVDHTVTTAPITETGSLSATGVSLLRRGTHVLSINNQATYYLESRSLNLQDFASQHVVVHGTVQTNTDPKYLPVIVVDKLESLDGSNGLHAWRIPMLNILLQTPDDWVGDVQGNTAIFHRKDDTYALLTIVKKSDNTLPTGGTPSRIHGHSAVTINRPADLAEDVYIQDGSHVLSLHFNADQAAIAGADGDQTDVTQSFARILSSLQFISDSNSSVATGSGTDTTPCGGPAGVLCPAGSYCEITDKTQNIGRCKSI